MSKVFFTDFSTFDATPATIDISILGVFGVKFSVLLKGSFGGGTVALLGGDGTTYEPVKVTSPAAGATHTALAFITEGIYTFSACCTHLRFDLTGGAAPSIDLALLVETRP